MPFARHGERHHPAWRAPGRRAGMSCRTESSESTHRPDSGGDTRRDRRTIRYANVLHARHRAPCAHRGRRREIGRGQGRRTPTALRVPPTLAGVQALFGRSTTTLQLTLQASDGPVTRVSYTHSTSRPRPPYARPPAPGPGTHRPGRWQPERLLKILSTLGERSSVAPPSRLRPDHASTGGEHHDL
jgi:hypothetical protein